MAVFTFIVHHTSGTWTAKQHSGDLESSAATTWELQRKLTQLALQSAGSGAVSSSFSLITPTSAVAQVRMLFTVVLFVSGVWTVILPTRNLGECIIRGLDIVLDVVPLLRASRYIILGWLSPVIMCAVCLGHPRPTWCFFGVILPSCDPPHLTVLFPT